MFINYLRKNSLARNWHTGQGCLETLLVESDKIWPNWIK